jgi:acyl carrier protein
MSKQRFKGASEEGAVVAAIYKAIDNLNAQRPAKKRLKKEVSTGLYDDKGDINSIELVTMVVAVEQAVEKSFGVTLTLADKAFSQKQSPFKTVGALAAFVSGLLKEQGAR